MRRILLAALVLLVLVGAGVGLYLYQLTAPVEVSNQAPVAPTLSLPAVGQAPSSASTQSVVLPASTRARATDVPSAPDPQASSIVSTPQGAQSPVASPAATGERVATPPAGAEPAATPRPTVRPAVRPSAAPTRPGTARATAPTARPPRLFRIDPKRSVASYSVDEVFLSDNRFNTAVGRTSAVVGDLIVNASNPASSQVGEIVVDISQLTSDESARDNAIRRNWLESRRYPLARFKPTELRNLPAQVVEGRPFTFQMVGDLTVHETTKQVVWDVTATLRGDELEVMATTGFKMSQFNVKPPNIAGFVRAEDDVELTLDLTAAAVEAR